MKGYELLNLNCNDYKYLVLSTSFETPLTRLDDITYELLLKCQKNNTKVIFDLLLNMGNSSDRFVEALFNGQQENITAFNFITLDKKNILRKISSDYLRNNQEYLENSVLNSEQKKLVSRGVPI